MSDMTSFMKQIQQISSDTMASKQPADFYFGTVISDSPLQIRLTQKLILSGNQLVLTRNVTDHQVKVSISGWETETKNGHQHGIEIASQVLTVHNALQAGEKVVVIKEQGGQRYLVVDRVV